MAGRPRALSLAAIDSAAAAVRTAVIWMRKRGAERPGLLALRVESPLDVSGRVATGADGGGPGVGAGVGAGVAALGCGVVSARGGGSVAVSGAALATAVCESVGGLGTAAVTELHR